MTRWKWTVSIEIMNLELKGDGSDVLLIFLDMAKAFDKAYHTGLLHKLQNLELREIFSNG